MTDNNHVVVVGGGISGLTAAWQLVHAAESRLPRARRARLQVTVLEAQPRFGGKIDTRNFAGLSVDTGPDAFLARVPWAHKLCQELGMEDELVSPNRSRAWIWSADRLVPFPSNTILGIPDSPWEAMRSGLLSPEGALRSMMDRVLPQRVGRISEDSTIGAMVRARLGSEVADRMVDPLLGNINGGSIDYLSLESAAPQVADVSAQYASLMRSVGISRKRTAQDAANRPTFLAPVRGMSSLVERLSRELQKRGVNLRTSVPVGSITRAGDGWTITTDAGKTINASAVVVAAPAPQAAIMLQQSLPEAAALLERVRYTSVSMVRLAYPVERVTTVRDGTGFVVPAVDHKLVTACSWASSKWSHLNGTGNVILRASVGRMNDRREAALSPEELTEAVHSEIAPIMGIGIRPVHADVTRWPDSFPQYEPGHSTLVLRLERVAASVPNLAITGAAMHGLGIPACIRSAREAVEGLLSRSSVGQHRAALSR